MSLQNTRHAVNHKRGPAGIKSGKPGEGMTIYDEKGKVELLIVPPQDNARSRTIRIHEVLHANNSSGSRKTAKKYKISEFTCQAVEDAYVHLRYWPSSLGEDAGRDAQSVALRDMLNIKRSIKKSGEPLLSTPSLFNGLLYTALRSLAIGSFNGSYYPETGGSVPITTKGSVPITKILHDAVDNKKVSEAIGRGLSKVLNSVIRRKRKEALTIFESLLMKDGESKEEGEQYGTEMGEGTTQDAAGENPMRIVRLAMTERTQSEHMEILPMRNGSRIKTAMLPTVLATCNPFGLFERERMIDGDGAILIDASGSMQPTQAQLEALCKSAPGATVAYYNGPGRKQADGSFGTLWIFSENGMRADSLPMESLACATNSVDLFALRWLLHQTGPHYFVTDQGFCGGPAGQDIAAHVLLGRSPEVEVIGNLNAALLKFKELAALKA